MNAFNFISPTYFVFGKETERECGKLCRSFGAEQVLLHYGGKSAEASGLLDRVRESLREAEVPFIELGGVKPNPRSDMVYEGIELCRREQVDFILAVGGGSVIDSAKAIAAGVYYDGDFWEFFAERGDIETAIPLGTVLTLPATGSEASDATVITNTKTGQKFGYGHELLRPVFSVMNPELCYTLPAYQTACGVTDMIAHILERYLSNTPDVGLTDRLCEAAIKSIVEYAPRAISNPRDYEARANLMWAGTIAHNDVLGVGREQDWSSHAIEHELSALYDVAHGAGLAVVFPAFMHYTLKHDPERYAQLAYRVWNVEPDFQNPEEAGRRGIEAFRAFFKAIGMPVTFAELGAKKEDIPRLAQSVRLNNGDRLGYFMPLTREDIQKIYELCL